MSACIPMNEKIIGDKMATAILLIRLYEISVGTFPPSIPVMTGAAVAVGQKRQMKVPSAMIGSQNKAHRIWLIHR